MTGVVNQTGARSGIVGTNVGTPSSNAADIGAGVLPVGVTGGSGLTALGTVVSGNISHADIVYPAGHVIQAKHFHYASDLTIGTTSHSIPFVNTVDTGSPSLDFGCPITKIASSDIYISGIITHGFPDEDQWTRFRGFHSVDAGSNWVDFSD